MRLSSTVRTQSTTSRPTWRWPASRSQPLTRSVGWWSFAFDGRTVWRTLMQAAARRGPPAQMARLSLTSTWVQSSKSRVPLIRLLTARLPLSASMSRTLTAGQLAKRSADSAPRPPAGCPARRR
jgi:hypothetical protein